MWGVSVAFQAGAVLSAALASVMGYSAWTDRTYAYLAGESNIALVGLVLAATALSVNVVASRRRAGISEQSHPMNLPVFG